MRHSPETTEAFTRALVERHHELAPNRLNPLMPILASLGRQTEDLLLFGQSQKAVETAVGPKNSCLHFQAMEADGIYRVWADYRSEGRNILECVTSILDMNDPAQWLPSITDVCRIVDETVDASYARSLWLSRQMAPEINAGESAQPVNENGRHEP